MKQDKPIELCARCAEEYAKGLEITNIRLEKAFSGLITCGECGRKCWGSSYRLRRRETEGTNAPGYHDGRV